MVWESAFVREVDGRAFIRVKLEVVVGAPANNAVDCFLQIVLDGSVVVPRAVQKNVIGINDAFYSSAIYGIEKVPHIYMQKRRWESTQPWGSPE